MSPIVTMRTFLWIRNTPSPDRPPSPREIPGRRRLSLAVTLAVTMACCGGPEAAGDRAWDRGDMEEAARVYSALEAPGPLRAQRLARVKAASGDGPSALELLEAVPEGGRTVDGWMALGLVHVSSGDAGEAVRAFEAGLGVGRDPALMVNLCGALVAAGRPDPEVCAEALLEVPGDPAAIMGLALAAMAQGSSMLALRTLQDLVKNPSVSQEMLGEAAAMALSMGDGALACRAMERVEWASCRGGEGCGWDGPAPVELGKACAAAGMHDTAREILEPVAPEEPEAAFVLGTMALERALAEPLGPARERAVEEARGWLEAGAEAHREDPDWWNNAGRLQALEGEVEAAEASFRRALDLSPAAPFPTLNLSRLLQADGRGAEARPLLAAVPRNGVVGLICAVELASLDAALGRREEALEGAREVQEACEAIPWPGCAAEAALVIATLLAGSDPDEAFSQMERVVAHLGEGGRRRLEVEPALSALRSDPRYLDVHAEAEEAAED